MALRHQVVSTDPVKMVNEKSSSRICKEEYTTENGKRLSGIRFSHSEARATLIMPGSKIKAGCSTHESKLLMADCKGEDICKAPSKEDSSVDRESEDKSKTMDGDVLLQWGQRKRQRNGRFESKATAAEESSAFSTKSVKITRRSTVVEKQPCSSPPLQPNRLSRGHIPRFNPAVRETTCTNGRKNVDTCSLTGSVNHVSNGLTVPVDKAHLRPSASFLGQTDTAVDCNGTVSGGALAMNAHGRAEVEANHGELPILEKVDLESFEWPKFVIPLSRKEKEDDFLAIKGSKLPQRPKKRPKHIEKALHYVSPGMWLSDLTRERYEVKEKKAVKKRPRGLKAMGSVDSDSE